MATQEPADELAALWGSAITEYAKDTTGKDKDTVILDTLLTNGKNISSPDELLVQIEASGQSFKDFRSKRGKLWGTLKLFVAPLSAVLKISITPSSVGEFGIPVSAVLGACLHLVRVR
jgi:fungal STAND N-terminal Goodbye domain